MTQSTAIFSFMLYGNEFNHYVPDTVLGDSQALPSERLLGQTTPGKYRGEVPRKPGLPGNWSVGAVSQAGGTAYTKCKRGHKAWRLQQLVIRERPWSSSAANTNVEPERAKEITIRDLHLLPLGTSNIYELT